MPGILYIFMGGNPPQWSCSIWMSVHLHHALAWLCFVPRPCFSSLPHHDTRHLLLHSFVEMKPIQSEQHASLPGATPETKELGLYRSLFPNLRLGKQYLSGVCALKCLHISSCRTTRLHGSTLSLYHAGGGQCSFSSLWALWTETSLLHMHVKVTDVVTGPPGEAHNYVFWHGQSTPKGWSPEHCGYDPVQSSWPVVLAPLSGVVTWDGGWEHFPARCDQFFQPRPP